MFDDVIHYTHDKFELLPLQFSSHCSVVLPLLRVDLSPFSTICSSCFGLLCVGCGASFSRFWCITLSLLVSRALYDILHMLIELIVFDHFINFKFIVSLPFQWWAQAADSNNLRLRAQIPIYIPTMKRKRTKAEKEEDNLTDSDTDPTVRRLLFLQRLQLKHCKGLSMMNKVMVAQQQQVYHPELLFPQLLTLSYMHCVRLLKAMPVPLLMVFMLSGAALTVSCAASGRQD